MHSPSSTSTFTPPVLAYDDTGGTGPLVIALPGAGDLRSEYRFVVDRLVSAGYRVVTADLPGHGESPAADRYTVGSTADALAGLIRRLDAGPAVVLATSFAPAAAVWLAAEHAELISGVVAISPHFGVDSSALTRWSIRAVLLRGPWAAPLWAKFYAGWYKADPPADLDAEIARIQPMLKTRVGRRAVRETLTAGRGGVAQRMERTSVPTLTIFGSADDHFTDPVAEASRTAQVLGGDHLVVDGAGHYPHVEQPGPVADAIVAFADGLR